MKTRMIAASLALLMIAGPTDAAVYVVNQTIAAGAVTGTVTTNGTTGILYSSDFTAWNLLLTGSGGVSYAISEANSVVVTVGSSLTATANDIFFNYDSASDDYLLFQDGLFSGMRYWCNASTSGNCIQGATVVPESFNSPSAQFEGRRGTRSIAAAPVPEPGVWLLLLSGFAMIGTAMRHRSSPACPSGRSGNRNVTAG